MTQSDAAFWLTVIGTACWGVCFWWMKRISAEQYRLMEQLREQGRRIEQLSTIEHDLVKEVHPQVGAIKEGMDEIIAAVKEGDEAPAPPGRLEGDERRHPNAPSVPGAESDAP